MAIFLGRLVLLDDEDTFVLDLWEKLLRGSPKKTIAALSACGLILLRDVLFGEDASVTFLFLLLVSIVFSAAVFMQRRKRSLGNKRRYELAKLVGTNLCIYKTLSSVEELNLASITALNLVGSENGRSVLEATDLNGTNWPYRLPLPPSEVERVIEFARPHLVKAA